MKNFTSVLVTSLLISTVSFSQAGSLDPSFSEDGIVTAQFKKNSSANSVAIQPDGKIVVAGTTDNNANGDFALARYQPGGTLDSAFGVNGQVITGNKSDEGANSVAIQADGKIVVAGFSQKGSNLNFALVRYMQNGKRDTAFGKNGEVNTDFGPFDIAYSVAIQSNGKIVVAGYTPTESSYDFALARYTQNGKPDSAFGTNSKVTTDFFGSNEEGHSLAIQSDGKILVAGDTFNGSSGFDFALVRYKSNGGLDSAFGTNGKVLTDFGEHEHGNSVAIQADGRIVVAGYTGYPDHFVLARYKPNGNLDSVFGINGKVITDVGSDFDYGRSVALQADGKIVVAGKSYNDFALVRYRHDGRLDNSFGIKGKVITDFQGQDIGNSVTLQPDGKIVVAGESNDNFAVARYLAGNSFHKYTGNNNFSNLQKQNNTSNIHLSPNPVKDILHVEGLSSSTKPIFILDAKGKLLQQITTANSSYSFNVKQFAAGIYFIRIGEGDKTTALKFIKE